MFVLSRDVSAAKRVIATLLATAIVLWSFGSTSIARADNVQNASDLISDSAPGAESDHIITFNLVNDLADAETVVITFDPDGQNFNLTGVTAADFAITAGTATFSEAVNDTLDTITFTKTGGAAASGTAVTVTVDGPNKISNPTPVDGNESYEIQISAGTDSGYTRVVILDTVLVTAAVETIFEFTVTGLDAGVGVNGATTNATSSSTTIPFGTLVANTPVILAQDLQVVTNAINGFVVTVQSDGDLESSTGADIDIFNDSVLITDPETWSAPANTINDENTWGHWGITTEDTVTDRTDPEFGANEWAGVTTTPTIIFSHTTTADGAEPGVGSTTVGYQVEISPLQEAADDYSTTLTYIATPTF